MTNNRIDNISAAELGDPFLANWAGGEGIRVFNPTLTDAKLMRDPCIIRGGDGLCHMVWTVSWKVRGIGYASSKDLIHWSEQKFIPVMEHEPEALNCSAPEITNDARNKEYIIYWATTISGGYTEKIRKVKTNIIIACIIL